MTITRFTPVTDFVSLREAMDRLFEDSVIRPNMWSGLAAGQIAVPVDLWETNDAYHVTAPPEDGNGAVRSMVNAMRNAQLDPTDIDYINAHGTSTQIGDIAECVAVKRCFGEHAARLAISSTKSMTGHLLGAAGGVEAVFTVLALRDQIAPPTANLFNRDPRCDLDFVPNEARKMTIRAALSNSFGFGGTNATLAFRSL